MTVKKRYAVDMATYRKALAELVVSCTDYSEENQEMLERIFAPENDNAVIKMYDQVAGSLEDRGLLKINLPRTVA